LAPPPFLAAADEGSAFAAGGATVVGALGTWAVEPLTSASSASIFPRAAILDAFPT